METRTFRKVVLSFQAHLQALEVQLTYEGKTGQSSEILDKISDDLQELLTLSNNFSQTVQPKQEFPYPKLQAFQDMSLYGVVTTHLPQTSIGLDF